MTISWQNWLVIVLGAGGLVSLVGWWQNRDHFFRVTPFLGWLGVFVWGDGLLIGLWWTVVAVLLGVLRVTDWVIEVVICFWLVRAVGETVYWIGEQFAVKKRNNPQDLWGEKWMRGEAIYVGYQLFWQLVSVVMLVLLVARFRN